MADFTRNGYGQVEANQLSAQKTGQIFASLPLASEVSVLQNGEFMYYDYANNCVTAGVAAGAGTTKTVGEPMLVFNEVKLYDGSRETYRDFAIIRAGDNYVTSDNSTDEIAGGSNNAVTTIPGHTDYNYRMSGFAPRLLKTNIGDVFTTNMVKTGVEYAAGDLLTPVKNATSKTLVLEKNDPTANAEAGNAICALRFVVAKVYTMPDGQPGLKLQRVE